MLLAHSILFYVVFFFSSIKIVTSGKNYCSLDGHHTMCMYNTTSSSCVKYSAVRNQETIEKIIKDHNRARSKYASGHSGFFVSNMLKLYWDQELADISARWSCQCRSHRDRNRDVDRFKVAQVVWSQQDSQTYHNWNELWYHILKSDFSGFYTRDYWGHMISNPNSSNPLSIIYNPEVKYLGCTLAQYQVWVDEEEQLVYKTTLVCNYGPYEGIPKKPPAEDWPCRACPPDHPCFTEFYVLHNTIPENLPDERNLCIDPKLENSKPKPGKTCDPARNYQLIETLHGQGIGNGSNGTIQRPFDGWNETIKDPEDIEISWKSGEDTEEEEQPVVHSEGQPINYCKVVCRSGEVHTMCRYKEDQYEDEELDSENETGEAENPNPSDTTKSTGDENSGTKPETQSQKTKENTTQGTTPPRRRRLKRERAVPKRLKIPPERMDHTAVEPAKRTKIPPTVVTQKPTTVKLFFPNGRRCKNYLPMTNSLIMEDLLRLHNDYRNDFAEGKVGEKHYLPGNMLIMKWDKSLQTIAERWIKQCHLYHDECRDSVFEDPWSGDMRLFEVGQNIGWRRFYSTDDIPSHQDLFHDWLNQSRTFPGRSKKRILQFNPQNGSECNYAQIVWAATYMVGCAFAVFEDTISRVAYLVCNYAPIGCSLGKSIYIPGGPCTLCDSNSAFEFSRCTKHFPNLCSLEWFLSEGPHGRGHVPSYGPSIAGFCSSITLHVIINYFVIAN